MTKKAPQIYLKKAQECAIFVLDNKEDSPEVIFEKLQPLFPEYKTERIHSNFLKALTLELARYCYRAKNWTLFTNLYEQFSAKIIKNKIVGKYSEYSHPDIFENEMLKVICDESVKLMEKDSKEFSLPLFEQVLNTLKLNIGITKLEKSASKKASLRRGSSFNDPPRIILKLNSMENLAEKKYELLFFWEETLKAIEKKDSAVNQVRWSKNQVKSLDIRSLYMSAYERIDSFQDFKRFDIYFSVENLDFSASLMPERFSFLCQKLLTKTSHKDLLDYFIEKCEASPSYFKAFKSLIFSDYSVNSTSEPIIPFLSKLNTDNVNEVEFLKNSYLFAFNHSKKLSPEIEVEDLKIASFNDAGYYAKDKKPTVSLPYESNLFLKKIITENLIQHNLKARTNINSKIRF